MRHAAIFISALLAACSTPRARATRTPVVAGTVISSPQAEASESTPTIVPFRIDLPAQHAPPVTGWRPPLYPIPWAISPYDHFYFARPIAADQINWPLANYRYGGVFIGTIVHTGVDIDAPYGTRILAAGPGTVVWADWGLFLRAPGDINDPYGQAVVLRMDFGRQDRPLYSVYAHMSQIIAVLGQHVETGDVIGLVGDTGATTGPHVHFEVRWGADSFEDTYNPELWMAPPEGWGVLVGRLTDAQDDEIHQLEIDVQSTTTGRTRTVKTYAPGAVNSDPYYNENMVLGDLPAGIYKVTFHFGHSDEQEWMYIHPGQVTYFTFHEGEGFHVGLPAAPTAESVPPTPAP